MKLVDIPGDVILSILCLLRIQDILAAERTCATLRDIVTTRYLWLVKLQYLDQFCAPYVPPYVDVDQLSYSELRCIVNRAAHWHKLCINGLIASPETRKSSARLTTNYEPSFPSTALRRPSDVTKGVQLAPGGKYLATLRSEYFEVFNIQSGKCIWSYSVPWESSMEMQKFALDVSSRNTIFILITSRRLRTSPTFVFNIFQLNHDLETAVQVRKIAGIEFQKPNNTLNDIHYVVLDGEFAVVVVSSNQVRSLIVWDWHSNVIKEVIVGRAVRLRNLHVMHGHLFFILHHLRADREFSIEAVPLRQIRETQDVTIDWHKVKRSSTTLDPMNNFIEIVDVHNFALYDSARLGKSKVIQAAVTTRIDDELSEKSHIIVDRYVFDLLAIPLAFRHVWRSESREFSSSVDLAYEIKAPEAQSGHILIDFSRSICDENPLANLLQANKTDVVPQGCSATTSTSQTVQQRSGLTNVYSVGMDEDGEIFCAPLVHGYGEEETEIITDNCSGVLVRLVFNNRFVRADVHCLEYNVSKT